MVAGETISYVYMPTMTWRKTSRKKPVAITSRNRASRKRKAEQASWLLAIAGAKSTH